MTTNCAHCGSPVTSAATGRPRRYCDGKCRDAARNAVRPSRAKPAGLPCCADAKVANPRVRSCPQHKQWRQFARTSRAADGQRPSRRRNGVACEPADLEAQSVLAEGGSVRSDPDSWQPWKREAKANRAADEFFKQAEEREEFRGHKERSIGEGRLPRPDLLHDDSTEATDADAA